MEDFAPELAPDPQTGGPAPRLRQTFDYIKREKMAGVAEALPDRYEDFEAGMSDPDNVKALHGLFKDQKWEGAELDDATFASFVLEGVKKKELSAPSAAPAGSSSSTAGPPTAPAPTSITASGPIPATDREFVEPAEPPQTADGYQRLLALGGADPVMAAEAQALADAPRPQLVTDQSYPAALAADPEQRARVIASESQTLGAVPDGFERVPLADDFMGPEEPGTYQVRNSATGQRYVDKPLSKMVDGQEQSSWEAAARNFGNQIMTMAQGPLDYLGAVNRKIRSTETGQQLDRIGSNLTGGLLESDPNRGNPFQEGADAIEAAKDPIAPFYERSEFRAANPNTWPMATSNVAALAVPALLSAAFPEGKIATVLETISGVGFDGQMLEGSFQRGRQAGLTGEQLDNYALADGAATMLVFKLGGAGLNAAGQKLVQTEMLQSIKQSLASVPGRLSEGKIGEVLASAVTRAAPVLKKAGAESATMATLMGATTVKEKVGERIANQQLGRAAFPEQTLGEDIADVAGATGEGALIGGALGLARPGVLRLGRSAQRNRELFVEMNAEGQPARYLDDQGQEVDFGPTGPPPAVSEAVGAAKERAATAKPTETVAEPAESVRETPPAVVETEPSAPETVTLTQPVAETANVGGPPAPVEAGAAAGGAPEGNAQASPAAIEAPRVEASLPQGEQQSAPAPAYATPAENRSNGRFEKDGQTYARQAPLGERVARGNPATAEFSSNVQQPVQYAVMEAADLQPSHTGGTQNLNHFLPEAQPKNRSAAFDPASQKAIADIAAAPDLTRLGEAPNAYSGAPIVNGRGEALQGNGRGEGIRQHYRQGGESYRRDVVAAAEKVGIPAERVAGFKEPVLVRVADVSDQRARELGNFTAADTESGGKRRLDAKQASGRMSPEDVTTLTRLATPRGEATLTETVRGNTEEILRFLRKSGLVNETQLQTLVKADGTLTPQGVEGLASLYRQQLFREGDPNLPELFAELPAAAQGGLDRALGALLGVPESASVLPEVQDAIGGVREFMSSGTDFNTWAGQADMFRGGTAPRERYTPLTLKLVEIMATEKRPTYIARLFNEYAAAVKGEAASLFGETPPKPRAEAVRDTFGVTDGPRADRNPGSQEGAARPVEADQRPAAPESPDAPSTGAEAEPAAEPALADNPAERAAGAPAPAGDAGPERGTVVAEAPSIRPTQQRLEELSAERESLWDELEKAREANPMRNTAMATLVPMRTITPAEATVYVKLATNYLKTGLVKVQDVLAQMREDFAQSGLPDLASDADLRTVIQYAKDERMEEADLTRTAVREDLAARQAELETRLFGSTTATEADFGGTAVGKTTGALSNLQERVISGPARRLGAKLNEATNRAAVSKSAFQRELVYAVNAVSKGFVQTREQQLRSEAFIGQARERPGKEAQVLYSGFVERLADPAITDATARGVAQRESLRRIDRVMDPDFYEARTRDGFEKMLEQRTPPDEFAGLGKQDIDDLFAEHTALLSTEQLAAAGKLSPEDLTPAELAVYEDLKLLYNFVHDANFAIGKVSYDTWEAGRDMDTGEATYTARLYNSFELPSDLAPKWQSAMGGRRMETGLYKKREELESWKIANKVEDPVYAAVKRLRQTMSNRAIYDYSTWLGESQPHLVVKPKNTGLQAIEAARVEGEERGFVELGEGYGALSNTWVAPHVAEDFKGAFFTNQFMQRIYEVTKAYGSGDTSQHLLTGSLGKVRNLLKKTVTVYNPGTHVGNMLNNVTLSWFAGVDGVSMAAEQVGAVRELKEYSPTVRYLLDKGVLGGSLATGEFKQNLNEFQSAFAPAPPSGVVSRGLKAMEEFYRGIL